MGHINSGYHKPNAVLSSNSCKNGNPPMATNLDFRKKSDITKIPSLKNTNHKI